MDWRTNGPDSIEARSSELGVNLRNISLACFLYSANSDSLYFVSSIHILAQALCGDSGWGDILVHRRQRQPGADLEISLSYRRERVTILNSCDCCGAYHLGGRCSKDAGCFDAWIKKFRDATFRSTCSTKP